VKGSATAAPLRRLRVEIRGAVQGVGFRPFVYRLARELGCTGWIENDARGVVVEAEAGEATLHALLERLRNGAPAHAVIQDVRVEWLAAAGAEEFRIRASDGRGARTALVQPDLATCPACLAEIRAGADRRSGYAFTNCTACGPRYSIVRRLPYDRPNTTMAGFPLCDACAAEYADPADRRFHAQPNACPSCGPRLALLSATGAELVAGADAAVLDAAVAALGQGLVVAAKGLGGYHLMVDARNEDAVRTLRDRKRRPTKPMAVLVRDLAAARRLCSVSRRAAALLESPAAPIVLLPRLRGQRVASAVAPGAPALGVMLPATPLHHLLTARADFPLVATSGNRSEEPICTTEADALDRLGGIADVFLVHDRPIERHVDDSVAWIVGGTPRLLRRARGYAPLPLRLARPAPPLLAVGAHLKNAIAVTAGRNVFVSQHIGDLDTAEARAAFERVIADLLGFYGIEPIAIAHDLHPDYASTLHALRLAERTGAQPIAVQHHHAHLAACLAEHGAAGPALGVVWDGTGYGTDGTIWGGEFLVGDVAGVRRAAHLLPFRLAGGEAAVREPARVGVALVDLALDGALDASDLPPFRAFPAERLRLLRMVIASGGNAPVTTSAGRLFDGLAALLGLRATASFEGEAAIALEQAADRTERGRYEVGLQPATLADGPAVLDWRPLVQAVVGDLVRGVETGVIAGRIHNGLAEAILGIALQVGVDRVALSGGCFQNRLLTERTAARLRRSGFQVLLHREVPPNDGGICLGQIAVAAARLEAGGTKED
jgi:hydrogenase maturation protein HypF